MTPTPSPRTPIAAFWADLGIQQGWMNEPVLMSDDPIWKMTAKEGYLFDDAFWEVFERHPFRICHVTYSGAPWSLEGGPPEMVLRFTQAEAEAAPAGGLRKSAEAMYVRIMHAHEDAIREGDPHQWWHNLEREWRSLGAALDGMPALTPASPSAAPLDEEGTHCPTCGAAR